MDGRCLATEGNEMDQQTELETLRVSESIKHQNLQELARLVLAYDDACNNDCHPRDFASAYDAMINFAKGVHQP